MGDPVAWPPGRRMRQRVGRTDHPAAALRHEFDRILEGLWRGYEAKAFTPEDWSFGGLAPHIDVSEDDDAVRVDAELPGVDEEHIELFFDNGLLTIRGNKKIDPTLDKALVLSERAFGAFRRAIPIAAAIDEDRVRAEYRAGVLTVTLPKAKPARRKLRRIGIKIR